MNPDCLFCSIVARQIPAMVYPQGDSRNDCR